MLSYCTDCAEERHECETCGDVCEDDSPCCPTDDDDTDSDSDSDTTEDTATPDSDSTPDSVPSVPEAADVPAGTFTAGQVVVFILSGWACEPGQIGTVSHMAGGYAQVIWDRRSGTVQNDGGYSTAIRLATPADIQAYETLYGGTR
jgi:hypothetical protein